eukprot:TRINITY_DN33992_c0_g1_i1.p1 TRINITY_DN33992_c0_g1~~TRINITY_DN33992_c0_g1_i1.p1  ORF type:complete len:703 (-),score=137.07 TRINITY_DN33992_c0_g1_i1:32-2107(-)
MAPMTVIQTQPEGVHFRIARDGSTTAWLRLQNVTDNQIAYKVKSTAPKNYSIKPGSGSIRAGEYHDVEIKRKTPEDGGSADTSKKDKFLVQAASVTTQAQKLLLYAADKGKAAGRTKFWDSIAKEDMQEQQLQVRLPEEGDEPATEAADVQAAEADLSEKTRSDLWKARKQRSQELKTSGKAADAEGEEEGESEVGSAAGIDSRAASKEEARKTRKDTADASDKSAPNRRAGYQAAGRMTDQDMNDIIGRMTKLGPDGKPVVQVLAKAPSGPPPPGFGGNVAPTDGSSSAAPAAPVERKPLQLTSAADRAKGAVKQDVVLNGHSRPITYVTFDASGKTLYTCAKDKLCMAWSVPDGECLRRYEGHRGAVWACSLNNDEGLLLTCGADGFIILYEAETGMQLLEVELSGVVRCVEWSFGLCLRFACACTGFKAQPAACSVFELSNIGGAFASRRCTSIEAPTLPSAASQVAWAGPYREWLCSVHDGGLVIFWNALTGSKLAQLEAHEETVSKIAVPALDGRLMATCGRNDMEVRLWCLAAEEKSDSEGSGFDDMGGDAPTPQLMRNFTCDRALNCVAVRPSLTFREAAVEDAAGGSCMLLAGGGQDARDVALVGAGSDNQFEPIPLRFAPVSLGDEVTPGLELCPAEGVWDHAARKGGHFGPLHVLAFSPDGKLCASGSEDGNVRLRELTFG